MELEDPFLAVGVESLAQDGAGPVTLRHAVSAAAAALLLEHLSPAVADWDIRMTIALELLSGIARAGPGSALPPRLVAPIAELAILAAWRAECRCCEGDPAHASELALSGRWSDACVAVTSILGPAMEELASEELKARCALPRPCSRGYRARRVNATHTIPERPGGASRRRPATCRCVPGARARKSTRPRPTAHCPCPPPLWSRPVAAKLALFDCGRRAGRRRLRVISTSSFAIPCSTACTPRPLRAPRKRRCGRCKPIAHWLVWTARSGRTRQRC